MSAPEIDLEALPMAPEWEATEGPSVDESVGGIFRRLLDSYEGELTRESVLDLLEQAEYVALGDYRTPANARIEDDFDEFARGELEKWKRRDQEGRP